MTNKTKEPTIFPEGIMFKRPREGAPDFVKGAISINIKNLTQFMAKFPNTEWLNIDLKLSKDKKLYLQLNTFGLKDVVHEKKEEINTDDVVW